MHLCFHSAGLDADDRTEGAWRLLPTPTECLHPSVCLFASLSIAALEDSFAHRLSGLLTARFLLLLRAHRPFKPSARLGNEEDESEGRASASAHAQSEVAVAVGVNGLSSVWDDFGPVSPISPVARDVEAQGQEGGRPRQGSTQLEPISEEERTRNVEGQLPEFVVGSSSFRSYPDS